MTADLHVDAFYQFGDAGKRGVLHVQTREPLVSPRDEWRLLRGEWRPEHPLVFDQYMGVREADVIGTTYAALFLVSERVVAVLRTIPATGWDALPVEVYGKGRRRIEGYSVLAVRGRAGPERPTESAEVVTATSSSSRGARASWSSRAPERRRAV